jgi:hypothetical protein
MFYKKLALTLAAALLVPATANSQQAASPTPVVAAAAEPVATTAAPAPAVQPTKVKLREGTEIRLVFAESVSSATSNEGDRINLRVDESVKVDGITVIHNGAMGVGTVTSAHKRGFMGKAGDLNIMLDYVSVGDERVRVRANKGKEGEGRIGSTVVLTVLFGPLGLLKRGKDVEIKAGAPITAFVDQDVELAITP